MNGLTVPTPWEVSADNYILSIDNMRRLCSALCARMIIAAYIDWGGLPCPMTLATLHDVLADRFEQGLRDLTSSFAIGGESEPRHGTGSRPLLITLLTVRATVRQPQHAALRTLLTEFAEALRGTLKFRVLSSRTSHGADSSARTARRRGTPRPRAGPRSHLA